MSELKNRKFQTFCKNSLLFLVVLGALYGFKKSYRLLLKTEGGTSWFVNLTFNCTKYNIWNSGCLTSLSIDKLDTETTYIPHVYYSTAYNVAKERNYVFSYKTNALFRIDYNNKQTKSEIGIHKNTKYPTTIKIGIPTPFNLRSLDNLTIKGIIFHTEKYNKEKINLPVLNALINLSYDVSESTISNFKVSDSKIKLIHFKETTFNNSKPSTSIQKPFSFKNIFGFFKKNYKIKGTNEELYEHYINLYDKFKVYKRKEKLGVVVFIDRIDLTDKTLKEIDIKNGKYNLLPCFEENFLLVILKERIFSYFLSIENDTVHNYNNYLLGLYKVKKVSKIGRNARYK